MKTDNIWLFAFFVMYVNRSIERNNRMNRSDTIGSTGPVPVSVGNPSSNGPTRMERRSTIDSIMNNPVRQQYNAGGDQQQFLESSGDDDRVSYLQSGRQSMYYDEASSHRKSRIGGMFKKMFKKDEQ